MRRICRRLDCRADRARMSAVCPGWRGAIKGDASLLSSAPYLYYPNVAQPAVACLWCPGVRHVLNLPETVQRARLFGSHEGGWLLFAEGRFNGHKMYNVGTGEVIPLPDELRREPGAEAIPVMIRSATLSTFPGDKKGECVGAALVECEPSREQSWIFQEIMFWKVGNTTGWGSTHPSMIYPRAEACVT